mgnify:CR=1 FL=1
MARKRRKRIVCPNCDKQLKEEMNFCFNCGQENHIKRVSVAMLVSDFSSTYFSFDSKLFSSLKYLLIKPSFLSLEYLNGKIEAYLRPIRMYIFISFAFFLLNSITSTNGALNVIDFSQEEESIAIEEAQSAVNPLKLQNNENEKVLDDFDEILGGKFTKIFSDEREKKSFMTFLMSKLPLLIFFLIPVFGGLLYIFFYRKKYYFVDHLVFALHIQSFFFVLLIINTVIDWVFKFDTLWIAVLGLLIYGYIAALKFYERPKLGTFIRLSFVGFVLSILSVISLVVFFLLLVKYYNI